MISIRLHTCLQQCLIILILGCLFACTESDNTQLTLVRSGVNIKLPLDSTTLPYSKVAFNAWFNGTHYYYYLSEGQNTIHEFDLGRSTQTNRLVLAMNGPNGVGNVKGFRMLSRDSLIIVNRSSELFFVNSKGVVTKKIDYSLTQDGIETTPAKSISSVRQQIETIGDSILLLTQLPGGNWKLLTNEDFNRLRVCLQINLNTNEIRFLPLTYPKDLMIDGFKGVYFSRLFENNKFLYSFEGDNNVYVTSDHLSYSKITPVGSNLFQEVPVDNSSTLEEYLALGVRNPRYLSIIYDPYRKIYYRFVYPGYDFKKGDELYRLLQFLPRLAIIILDENLAKIGEVVLPDNTFLRDNYFVNKDGLYLSINHPESDSLNDDFLAFERLEISSVD